MQRDIVRYCSVAALVLLVTAVVDGAAAYPQLLLFGGTLVIPTVAVKLALFVLSLATAAWRLGTARAAGVTQSGGVFLLPEWGGGTLPQLALTFFLYLSVQGLFFSRYPLPYTARGFNAYYFYLLLAPLFAASGLRLQSKTVGRTMLALALPLLALGFLQSLFGAPLLPVQAADGSFETHAWKFYGAIRAFSLFASPASFGAFLVLVAVLCLALVRDTSGTGQHTYTRAIRICMLMLFVLALSGILLTRTRAVWLHATLSLAALVLWPRIARVPRLRLLLPVLTGAAGLLLVAVFLAAGGGSMVVAESLLQRFDGWWYAVSRWLNGDGTAVLFGTGFFQHGTANGTADLLIDSTFIGAGVQIGITGLALLVLLQSALWNVVSDAAVRRGSPLSHAVAAFCAPWVLLWLMGIATVPLALVFLCAILGGVFRSDGETQGVESRPLRGSGPLVYVSGLVFTALVVVGALHTPASSVGPERWESRARMKLLQAAQHAHRAQYGRWCDGVDSLTAYARGMEQRIGGAEKYLPLYDRRVPVDSIRVTPGSGRAYVVIATPDGALYQIRDPDGHGYISSWSVPEEFDRASWR